MSDSDRPAKGPRSGPRLRLHQEGGKVSVWGGGPAPVEVGEQEACRILLDRLCCHEQPLAAAVLDLARRVTAMADRVLARREGGPPAPTELRAAAEALVAYCRRSDFDDADFGLGEFPGLVDDLEDALATHKGETP